MKLRTMIVAVLSLAIALPPLTATAETTCGGHAVTVEGTDGDDDLLGTTGPDVIAGLDGNDTIVGRGGRDVICDGPGSDAIDGGSGNDVFYRGEGPDFVEGGKGSDLVSYIEYEVSVVVNLGSSYADVSGGSSDEIYEIESAAGTFWDDTLIGDDGPNILVGRAGADDLFGIRGNDSLYGKNGRDRLRGGIGDDLCETQRQDRLRDKCERSN
jgi:Ca2+-binding RTX toxin-like protein